MTETRVNFAAKIDKEGRNCHIHLPWGGFPWQFPPQGIHLDGCYHEMMTEN